MNMNLHSHQDCSSRRKEAHISSGEGSQSLFRNLCRAPGISTSAAAPNPKGIPQQSPGLRGTSYPGIMRPIADNPERVAAHDNGNATRPQPRWGCETPGTSTQGS